MRCPPSAPCSPPCRRPDLPRAGIRVDTDAHGRAHDRRRSQCRIVGLDEELVGPRLVVADPLGQGVAFGDGGGRAAESRLPLVRRLAREALGELGQLGAVPVSVREARQSLRRAVVETPVVDPDESTQLAPPFGATEVHHDAAPVGCLVDPQDHRVPLPHDPGWPSLPVEDRRGVEEEQPVEQRRLDVLSVPGRLALDERRRGAQDGQQRRGDARRREREPDRFVPGEQSLLCSAAGVHQGLPSRIVPGRSARAPRGDRARHEAGSLRLQRVCAEAQPLQCAGPQVLH